ncbi:MAG: hypothetical protein ACI837_001287 [Crocinitomicaceae bacterium]|jgi:hypothetical protein
MKRKARKDRTYREKRRQKILPQGYKEHKAHDGVLKD